MDATRHADDDDDDYDDDDETVSLTRKEAHDETEVQADTSAAAGNHTASYKSMSINCRRSTKVAYLRSTPHRHYRSSYLLSTTISFKFRTTRVYCRRTKSRICRRIG